jgi:hypothetical protein
MPSTRALRFTILFALLLAPTTAGTSVRVALSNSFLPDRLGESTTIRYGFQITSSRGQLPPPLLSIDLQLPAGMGLASSSLGLTSCDPTVLEEARPERCPAEARLGYGRAEMKVPADGETIAESGDVVTVLGAPQGEHIIVLFHVEGKQPVETQLVFAGELLGDNPPFGSRLLTALPLVPVWPEGPDVILTSFSSTIGPLHLTYYRRLQGELVPFHPRGIVVPNHCPRRGFPFAAGFRFANGTSVTASSCVPCPVPASSTATERAQQRRAATGRLTLVA